MGYYMDQRDVAFAIKKENVDKAFNAIRELADRTDLMHSGSLDCPSFAWVTPSSLRNAHTLYDIMDEWGWIIEFDQDDNVDYII